MVYEEATSSDVEKQTILSEKKAAFSIAETRIKKQQKGKEVIETEIGPVLSSPAFELFFLFTTNCRLKTPLERLQNEILNDNQTMVVGKDNFKDRYAMFACLALDDEGVHSYPKTLKEKDIKDGETVSDK